MKRTLVHLADKLAGYMPQARFHSRSFYTGPNHAILYAAALTRGGRMFRHRGWRQLAMAFAERFAAFQDPEGYWAEHDGPVGIYSSVSLAGIAAIHRLEPRPIFQNALERALRYHETVVYPDYTSVALIDRRMRYQRVPFIWGGAGFTRWPRGRAFLRALARARLRCDEPFTAEEVARWLEAYVHCRRGPAPPYTPWRGVRYLGRHACFIRDRGWQVNFSVNPVMVDPTQSFSLDYQKVVSLWHRRTGLIVDGSQDKHHPEHDNFLFPGRTDPGVMVTGLIATQCKPRFVEAMYSNHIAVRVEADILDAANMVLTARETGLRRIDAVRFNLPLRVGVGSTIHVGRRPVVLSGKKCAVRVKRGEAVSLFDGNLVMRCDRGGRLHFPCLPWNSYSVDNRSGMEAAFLRFEIPLTGSPKSARVMFRLS